MLNFESVPIYNSPPESFWYLPVEKTAKEIEIAIEGKRAILYDDELYIRDKNPKGLLVNVQPGLKKIVYQNEQRNKEIEFYRTDEKSYTEGEYQYLQVSLHDEEDLGRKKAYCSLSHPYEVRVEGIYFLDEIPHIKDAPVIYKLLYVLHMEGSSHHTWSTYLDDETVEEILKVCEEELNRRKKRK